MVISTSQNWTWLSIKLGQWNSTDWSLIMCKRYQTMGRILKWHHWDPINNGRHENLGQGWGSGLGIMSDWLKTKKGANRNMDWCAGAKFLGNLMNLVVIIVVVCSRWKTLAVSFDTSSIGISAVSWNSINFSVTKILSWRVRFKVRRLARIFL